MILSLLICWQLINHYPTPYNFADASPVYPDVATCTFLPAHYPAFLVCTQSSGMNLSNATISATFTVECSPDAVFRCGNEGFGNTGPASARLFFGSVVGYANQGTGSTQWWFNAQSVEISTNTGTAALAATFHPEDWTDAGGCLECPSATDSDFWHALVNVHEVGIALGGTVFWDTGIATVEGSAVFHLNYFGVYPKFSGYKRCFSSD